MGGQVTVRYHPEDLSRVFVSRNGKDYVEATFADLRRPKISLWEQRQARRELKASGSPDISEALIFRTIEMQKKIVARARGAARRPAKDAGEGWQPPPTSWPRIAPVPEAVPPAVNYDKVPEDSNVEIWTAGPVGTPRSSDPSLRGDG
jgi:putative transposase